MKHFLKFWSVLFTVLFSVLVVWGVGNAGLAVYFREAYDDAVGYYVTDDVIPYPINVLNGTIYAEGEWEALHETGHLADDKYEYPSQSIEFTYAIVEFLKFCYESEGQWYQFTYEDACYWILYEDDQDGRSELYAEIYQRYRWGIRFPPYVTKFFRPDWKELVQ